MRLTLTPAYGRDYKSQKEVRAAWQAGADFVISDHFSPDDGRYINRPQVPSGTTVNIRYKRLTQVCVLKS